MVNDTECCQMPTRIISEMPSSFWKWFDGKRQELDLSDSGVAARAGISQSVISKARSSERPIGFEALSKIAHALGTPVISVLLIAGALPEGDAPSPDMAEIAQLFDAMSDDDQEELLALARVKAKRNRRKKAEAEQAKGKGG